MNRRDLFKHIVGAAAAAGVEVQGAKAVEASPVPVLAVFEVTGRLSDEGVRNIADRWRAVTKGTPFERTKVVVLDEGLTLRLLDANGVINCPGFD